MRVKRYKPSTFSPNGMFSGMPMCEYMSVPSLNSSLIKLALEQPLTFKRQLDGLLPKVESEAMSMGTLLHSAILERKFDYHIKPETYGDGKKWNGNATECKEWMAAHSDKPSVSEAEAAFIADAAEYVRNHGKVRQNKLLTKGKPEVSAFATIDGSSFKGRFDYYRPGLIVDLKTVADASMKGFFRSALQYGWLLQASLYTRIAEHLTGQPHEFVWLALQKGPLPLLRVCKFGMFAKLLGEEELNKAIAAIATCSASGYWPEWADDADDEIKPLDVPAWAMNKDDGADEVTVGGTSVIV